MLLAALAILCISLFVIVYLLKSILKGNVAVWLHKSVNGQVAAIYTHAALELYAYCGRDLGLARARRAGTTDVADPLTTDHLLTTCSSGARHQNRRAHPHSHGLALGLQP